MARTLCGNIRLLTSVLLLLTTVYLYASCPDWWIYGLLSGSAGIINLFNVPESRCWRVGISTVIVLGAMETLFLTWTVRHLDEASLLSEDHLAEMHEGKRILIAAVATCLTISTKLSTSKHEGLLDVLRTGLVLALAFAMGPAIAYSILHHIPPLSNIMPRSVG